MKSKIIFAFITYIILFGINKSSLYKNIEEEVDIVKVVNISGRQRMYSQRITKLALYLNDKRETTSTKLKIETLQKSINNFSEAHQYLKNTHISQYNNDILTALFKDIEPYYLNITKSAKEYLKNPDNQKIKELFIETVKLNESDFLNIMDDIVNQYQKIAERKGVITKNTEFTFNTIVFLLTVYCIFAIIIPLFKDKEIS